MENKQNLLVILNQSNQYLETKKLIDLEIGFSYRLLKLKKIQTKFGHSIIATLRRDDEEFNIFLPKKYVKILNDARIKNVEECCDYFHLIYLGGEYHNFKFE